MTAPQIHKIPANEWLPTVLRPRAPQRKIKIKIRNWITRPAGVFILGRGQNFAKISSNFALKNMNFVLHKRIFHAKKNGPKFARFLEETKIQNCQICYDKFQLVAKNIEGPFFFSFFLLSYLVCRSQIWLNYLMDDHQFSYLTKLGQNEIK
jgi:UDP-N-acetylglucosamine transferase subunit ALG13